MEVCDDFSLDTIDTSLVVAVGAFFVAVADASVIDADSLPSSRVATAGFDIAESAETVATARTSLPGRYSLDRSGSCARQRFKPTRSKGGMS